MNKLKNYGLFVFTTFLFISLICGFIFKGTVTYANEQTPAYQYEFENNSVLVTMS